MFGIVNFLPGSNWLHMKTFSLSTKLDDKLRENRALNLFHDAGNRVQYLSNKNEFPIM